VTVPLAAPTLTDGAVTLRAHRAEDLPRMVEQCRDPVSIAWTTVPVPYAEADAEEFGLRVVPGGWADGSEWAFAVEFEGRYVGTVSLRDEGPGRAEIAFGSHPDVRGTGAVLLALRVLVDWGFAELGLETVVWQAFTGNWPSRRLAWRLGFTVEGTLRHYLPQRGERRDAWVGTLLKSDRREPASTWLDNPVVEGDGVRLRPFHAGDVPRIVEGMGDEQTQYWLAFLPRDPGEPQGHAYVEQVTERLATGHTITWAVSGERDLLQGVIGLYRMHEGPELGYWTHPDARGTGITTKAAALAVDHAFGELGLPRLAAFASVPNQASQRVLVRLGFKPTGVQRGEARTGAGEVVDLAGYDLLASEWATDSRSSVNATASTANPASDSAAPITSGDR
jgi:RimJ/RimL family protein N-acetyltransferase